MAIVPIRTFQSKITFVVILAALFTVVLNGTLIYQFNLHEKFAALRRELNLAAQTASLAINVQTLMQVPLKPEGVDSPQYQNIRSKLIDIRNTNVHIKDIYTMTKTSREGVWVFIVDADPFPRKIRGKNLRSFPGDVYEAGRFAAMMQAYKMPSVDEKLEIDEWGATLSGYAPIKDNTGKTVAIIGIDVDAKDVYSLRQATNRRMALTLLMGLFLSVGAGFIFSRDIHRPIKELVEGTRRVARGDLNYQLKIDGYDELSELGHAFNTMSTDLNSSRLKLVRYFYGVVRSLIKVLEARDQYTKGHSEKVASYAVKIALKMGVSKKQVRMFRKMTLLHDIGKVGVKDSILNKPNALTEDEWDLIRKHPIIGEQILKPVLDNPEMLSIVRGHHERYDGKGYPDGLSKEQINIFAAIVSVADAYDAMTSDRSYRRSMRGDEAVEELKKNSGTQFNPKVVEAFLDVLDDENKKKIRY